MFDNSSVFSHLKHQARCIEAQLGEEQKHCFFVGTYSPQPENELHLIEFIEETNEIITRNVFQHPNEIFSIACCPKIPSLLFTTHRGGHMAEYFKPMLNKNSNEEKSPLASNDQWWKPKITESVFNYNATLWRLVDLDTEESNPSKFMVADIEIDDENDVILDINQDYSSVVDNMNTITRSSSNLSLQPLFTLPNHSNELSIHSLLWDPTCWQTQCISLAENSLQFWRFAENFSGILEEKCVTFSDEKKLKSLSAGCWDPHYPNRFISTNDGHIRVWDAQNLKETQTILNAHKKCILSVDHNPNKPFNIITSSEDRTVRFWDLRKPAKPLKILTNHSHWIWCSKYNRYHDQLIISSGSDANISLWNIVSVSSAPMGELDDSSKEEDKLIRTYKESHEECIYYCSWSANNAWVFASLSFDGRVVVNHVPSATKYNILL